MKQHVTPLIIRNGNAQQLDKIAFGSKTYDENWIQEICFQNPNILPTEEIEITFSEMIPICTELSVKSGSADLIYLNQDGFITIGECKLWRNPQARREVIGQILDYAKDLSKWDYSEFENKCLKARKDNNKSLFNIVQELYPDVEEATFIDNVQSNLRKGRFLLAIIGDGIQENMEEMVDYIELNGNLNFTLALIEIPIYKNPTEDEIIISPRVLSKTVEIERIIYRISDTETEERKPDSSKSSKQTISDQVYYERLTNAIGKEKSNEFHDFIQTLRNDLNILPKLGRGKKISLNLKSPNDSYNFASIQEDGQVWFYGVTGSGRELGDKTIGTDYLENLAKIVGGKVDTSYTEWNWCVKKNEQYLSIVEYLKVKDKWIDVISDTLQRISKLEEEKDNQ